MPCIRLEPYVEILAEQTEETNIELSRRGRIFAELALRSRLIIADTDDIGNQILSGTA